MKLKNVAAGFHSSASPEWMECSSEVFFNMEEVGVQPSKNVKKRNDKSAFNYYLKQLII
jgi:hypothetical protein